MKKYSLYIDGSYDPRLKSSGIGGYLLDENHNEVFSFSEAIEDKNFLLYHELFALNFGLKKAVDNNIKNITCYSDDLFIKKFNDESYNFNLNINNSKKELIRSIFNLKNQFDAISFNHIKRNFNRKADKLAATIQIENFYSNLFFESREVFKNRKTLNIPNLVCIEDFNDVNDFNKLINNENIKINLNITSIDDINACAKLFIDNVYINKAVFEIKKVNSFCLNLLSQELDNLKDIKNRNIELKIDADILALQKFDMVLRKRFLFPKNNTPLVKRFLTSCSKFNKIILLN